VVDYQILYTEPALDDLEVIMAWSVLSGSTGSPEGIGSRDG
jgi:hypothetical protein